MTRHKNPAGGNGGADSNLRLAIDYQTLDENFYSKTRTAFQGLKLSDEARRGCVYSVEQSGVVIDFRLWRVEHAR
jgi:hypothetical protein